MTEDELQPGRKFTVLETSNTISRATYEIEVEIVYVENGHVHYRTKLWGARSPVTQTPIGRFLEIVNNQPPGRP